MKTQQWMVASALGLLVGVLAYYLFIHDRNPSRVVPPVTTDGARLLSDLATCRITDPGTALRQGNEALDDGEAARAEGLFEQAAACDGHYAWILGKTFDPTHQLAERRVEPRIDKALQFYAYAAVQGQADKAEERLSMLGSDPLHGPKAKALLTELRAWRAGGEPEITRK